MRRLILTTICITVICAITVAQNHVTAPKIISTIPAFGDCKVDPKITDIVIKFDQDMSDGMSVLDSKNMPQFTDKPHWIDKRTFSIPVKLYPNKLYSLLFNNWHFQGFQSATGIPLNPDELDFQTRVVSFTTLNKQSYNELIKIFPIKYSYATLNGIDWKSLLEQNRTELENSETQTEFALKLVKLLRISGDNHLWVEVEGQKFETGKTKIVNMNFSAGKQFTMLHDQKTSRGFNDVSGVIDSIGYIAFRDWNTDFNTRALQNWGKSTNPFIPVLDVIKELLVYPNLIIDVRENTGGNETYAKQLASLFIEDSVAYEKVKNYNEDSKKFDKETVKWLIPSKNKLKYSGKIYVLSGQSVMSSNESFILMMKHVPNAKIVGMKTYGSSGNPMPYELPNGVTVYIPSWQAYTLDGKMIEGKGIEPDIEIVTSNEDFQKTDGLLEKVVKMIEKRN